MEIYSGVHHFNEPLFLESGRVLTKFKLAYETYGVLNHDKSNAILVCHALTGSSHAAGKYSGDTKSGWWDKMIGSKKAIDTDKFFVICINILCSPFGSTCPLDIMDDNTGKQWRLKFPVVVISDVVKSQIMLLKYFGISKLHTIIGGSLGGMQALCYAIEHSYICDNIIMLASTYATPPWAIAFNKIAIHGIVNDPDFKNGLYDEDKILEHGLNGMILGRMAGHISFLSFDSMNSKFGRTYVLDDGLYELIGRFEVDRYLEYNSLNFAKRFDPLCYLYIAKMMNIFDCTRHYDTLENALMNVKAKLHLISFNGDVLFPPVLMQTIKETMDKIGKVCTHINVDSNYGHDAFLVEIDKFDFYVKGLING